MKIPLRYIDGYIYISAIIDIPDLRIRLKPLVNAIIDTGSPETMLGESQAIQWGVPLNKLTLLRNANMGGTLHELFKIGQMTLKFKDETNKFQDFKFEDMCVARTTKKDERAKQIAQAMPAIFGTNFLHTNNLTLHFAPHKNEAYLIRED